jgi:Prealbumin-like fold domain
MTILLVSLLMMFTVGEQEQKCDFPSKMNLFATGLTAYQVVAIEGEIVFTLINVEREAGHVQGVCLGLFNELNQTLITTIRTDKDGRFTFGQIKPGIYRLISQAPAYHTVDIPIRVIAPQAVDAEQKKRLMLHLRFRNDNRKSFATLTDSSK